MKNDIKRDYLWNTIGVFAQNAVSPLLLIVVTRVNGIYYSGVFSFAFAVAVIFWIISIWGGRTYQVSDVTREFPHRSYVVVRLILTILTIVGAIVFAVINHYDYFKTSVITALVLYKSLESIADAIHGVLQVNEQLYVAGKSLTYKAVGGFVLFTVVDVLTHDILLACLGIALVNVVLLFAYDLRIARRFESLSTTFKQWPRVINSALEIMRRTWPVFIVIFLSMFSLNIPRYFIDKYHSNEIGYFGILAMPVTLITLIMVFALQPKVVELSHLYYDGKIREFKAIVTRLLIITAGLGIATMCIASVVGIPAMNVVFGIDFSDYWLMLEAIIIGGVFAAIVSIFINILTIVRRFKLQFYTLLATNASLIFFSAIFVKMYGLEGGIVLYALTNLIQVAVLIVGYELIMAKQVK